MTQQPDLKQFACFLRDNVPCETGIEVSLESIASAPKIVMIAGGKDGQSVVLSTEDYLRSEARNA